MKRREFLTRSLAASALAGVVPHSGITASAAQAAERTTTTLAANREYYELRAYRLKSGASHDLLDAYLEEAAIPALNRLGAKPIGVFTETEPKDGPAVWVLIPYPSLEAFSSAAARINS